MSLTAVIDSPSEVDQVDKDDPKWIVRSAVVGYWRLSGLPPAKVAHAFNISRRTIYRWARWVEAGGCNAEPGRDRCYDLACA